jgi:hypothetical protein
MVAESEALGDTGVQKFNPYDLCSKSSVRPEAEKLCRYYTAVIDKYLPGEVRP